MDIFGISKSISSNSFWDKCLKLVSYVLGTKTKLLIWPIFDLGLRSENFEFYKFQICSIQDNKCYLNVNNVYWLFINWYYEMCRFRWLGKLFDIASKLLTYYSFKAIKKCMIFILFIYFWSILGCNF